MYADYLTEVSEGLKDGLKFMVSMAMPVLDRNEKRVNMYSNS